jgi:predicted nuclease with TOPRIM domain
VVETNVERRRTELSALRDEVEALNGEVRPRSQQLIQLQALVGQLSHRTLDTLFDDWKATRLRSGLREAMERTLAQFAEQVEIQKILQENRDSQQKTLEKARPWFQSMGSWVADLHTNNATTDPAVASFCHRFGEYCRRGQHLVDSLETSLAEFDLKTVPWDTGSDISFLDVVSGRSNEVLSTGYCRRLEERVRELRGNTASLQEQWESMRDELLELLDHFHGLTASQSVRGTGVGLQRLETSLRDALRRAKIQEIPVELDQTAYDASLHEVLAGARLTRPNLPENTVVALERRGFFCEGKVLRRALVTLSSKGRS